MNTAKPDDSFDCIIIGSGTAGATLARELSAKGQRVLMLERGKYRLLKETVWSLASMFNEVKVAHKLKDARLLTAGGSSAAYLAKMDEPPIDAFRAAGIDLREEYEAVRRELPLAVLPDALLSPQALCLREAALACGHDWRKRMMLIDQSLCSGGLYSYEAKWKALAYVDDAVRLGTTLQCQARVERVLIENNHAVGVECRVPRSPFGTRLVRFHAPKVVVAAGSLATPVILRNSGLSKVATKGYYIDPSLLLYGRVPGLQGRDSFAGTMYATLADGTSLHDANVNKLLFKMLMLPLRPMSMFSYPEHICIMVQTHDAVGGSLSADGRYHKDLDPAVFDKLQRGEEAARRILLQAGATKIFKAPMMTGGTLGTLSLNEDVDSNLETEVAGLYVCDGSLIPENGRVAPTLTLLCLARYLAKVLSEPMNVERSAGQDSGRDTEPVALRQTA